MQKFIENIPKDETCFLLLIPASLYHSVFFLAQSSLWWYWGSSILALTMY